jgi:hypothetical protein
LFALEKVSQFLKKKEALKSSQKDDNFIIIFRIVVSFPLKGIIEKGERNNKKVQIRCTIKNGNSDSSAQSEVRKVMNELLTSVCNETTDNHDNSLSKAEEFSSTPKTVTPSGVINTVTATFC